MDTHTDSGATQPVWHRHLAPIPHW